MTIMNLIPGQYQIDNLVMGRGTTVPVDTFDEKPYDINAQDFQMSRQDEMNFGQDQLKPTTFEIKFAVRYNWLLPPYASLIPNFWAEMPTISDFKRAWRADEVRAFAGQVKPFYLMDRNGIHKQIFGRPGNFTHAENTNYTEAVECTAEFRRLDTFSYSVTETAMQMTQAAPTVSVLGHDGDAPAWFRLLIHGPIINPHFAITNTYLRGDIELQMNYTIGPTEVVEITSYPWQRRIVNAIGTNLASKLVGQQPYLDRLRFANDATVGITMTGTSLSGATKALVLWHDAYQVAK
jgi:hypothetical protein